MKVILIIGIGGFVGAVSRFIISSWIQNQVIEKFSTLLPIGTFIVNIIGCLLLGFFGSYFVERQADESIKFLINIGFLGAFTTFSTFSYETLILIERNQLLYGFLNILISCAAGLMAAWFGQTAYRMIWR